MFTNTIAAIWRLMMSQNLPVFSNGCVNGAFPEKRRNVVACVNSAFLNLPVKSFQNFTAIYWYYYVKGANNFIHEITLQDVFIHLELCYTLHER